ncbi:FAD-dependent monooxygenase [Nocardia panacis]|uniref:FAD-dependent monooxygenase n=1 Tax=Nocardia panacis TaxID=2340916 RepID=UPI0011C49FCE|nr:FAD-dependent monooxygenase [Nocardia panacis]
MFVDPAAPVTGSNLPRIRERFGADVDVLVVGAGPAGIIAADKLSAGGGEVLLVDAGRAHTVRVCPVELMRSCLGCKGICNVISGFGGCVHYGDGVKLSRFPSGRRLAELLGPARAARLENEALRTWLGTGVPSFRGVRGWSPFPVKDYPVVPLTSVEVMAMLDRMHDRVSATAGLELRLGTEVLSLTPVPPAGWVARLRDRRQGEYLVRAGSVVVAVGRRGRSWWHRQIRVLGVDFAPPVPSVGVRFEMAAELLRGGAAVHEDFKTTLTRNGVKVKTFCFCSGAGGGRIKFTDYAMEGYTLLDGHVIAEPATDATANFALLAQLRDDDGRPWDTTRIETDLLTPYRRLRPDRPGKPVLQWLPDFRAIRLGCASVEEFTARSGVTPSVRDYRMANLAGILPSTVRTALLSAFDDLIGFFAGSGTAHEEQVGVIGLELENTWDELVVSPSLETSVSRLYAAGDCAGLAQGILQAGVGGLAAAEGILGPSVTPMTEGIAG